MKESAKPLLGSVLGDGGLLDGEELAALALDDGAVVGGAAAGLGVVGVAGGDVSPRGVAAVAAGVLSVLVDEVDAGAGAHADGGHAAGGRGAMGSLVS